MVTPVQGLSDLLIAVYNDGDGLLLNTDGHTVPPGQSQEKQTLNSKSINQFVQKYL